MTFYTINQQDTDAAVAEAAVIREQEIFSYDMNIVNYEIMLEALPSGDWPDNLIQYKRSTLDVVPDEYDQQVSEYQYRDRIRGLLKTERLEKSKAERIYQALISRIPEELRATVLLQAKERILARQS